MKYSIFINELTKIFEKKNITEKTSLSTLNFDSLKILEILAFADKNFNDLKLDLKFQIRYQLKLIIKIIFGIVIGKFV